MENRKLATLRIISKLEPIKDADRIELATVGGWKVITAKDVGHSVGDMVVYCEVDSFLPIKPEYEFLRKSSYRKLADGSEGFRLRTMRMRGQISQGLILPLIETFGDFGWTAYEGLEVTQKLGITKWDPPLPPELNGVAIGYLPDFIQKTDEERIQNLVDEYEEMKKEEYYEAEKLDGSSATYFLKDNIFGVGSRNLHLEESDSNSFWKVAREMKVEEKLKEAGLDNICIQGELIGEGIQKNPYKIKGQTVRFFTAFDIEKQKRLTFFQFESLMDQLNLHIVPILNRYMRLPDEIDELIKGADGKSVLNINTRREGKVYRSLNGKYSFKVISNDFLIRND